MWWKDILEAVWRTGKGRMVDSTLGFKGDMCRRIRSGIGAEVVLM